MKLIQLTKTKKLAPKKGRDSSRVTTLIPSHPSLGVRRSAAYQHTRSV